MTCNSRVYLTLTLVRKLKHIEVIFGNLLSKSFVWFVGYKQSRLLQTQVSIGLSHLSPSIPSETSSKPSQMFKFYRIIWVSVVCICVGIPYWNTPLRSDFFHSHSSLKDLTTELHAAAQTSSSRKLLLCPWGNQCHLLPYSCHSLYITVWSFYRSH